MTFWIVVGAIVVFLFFLTVLRGAPYVPTHRRKVEVALDLLKLQANDLMIDLGSGDGNVLKAAAKRGYQALGYEINPLLCMITWLRCLPQRSLVTVRWRDFWLSEVPPTAKGMFVFLVGPYMAQLGRKLEAVMSQRKRPLRVVSYGYAIPGFTPKDFKNGLYLYELQPGVTMDLSLQR